MAFASLAFNAYTTRFCGRSNRQKVDWKSNFMTKVFAFVLWFVFVVVVVVFHFYSDFKSIIIAGSILNNR